MPASQVANPGGSLSALVPNINMKRPLQGIVYPVLAVAVVVAFGAFAWSLGTEVFRPLIGRVAGNIPVVGGALSQSGGNARFDLEVPT